MEATDRLSSQGAGLRCAACDIELTEKWTFLGGEVFCCRGCGAGGPCVCTYEDYEAIPAVVRHPEFMRNLLRIYLDAPRSRS
jgi:hypothetical protein